MPSYTSLDVGGRTYIGPSATTTVTPAFPRLAPTKSTSAGTTANLGEAFPWRLTLTNATGAGTATSVAAVDTLPAGWTYTAGSARVSVNGSASTVEPSISATGSTQTLTWTGLGPVSSAASLVIDYSATPTSGALVAPGVGLATAHRNSVANTWQDATSATGYVNTPYAAGPATADARIASADLAVVKTVRTQPVAGGTGSWDIVVRLRLLERRGHQPRQQQQHGSRDRDAAG